MADTVITLTGKEARAELARANKEIDAGIKRAKKLGAKSTEGFYIEGNKVRSVVRG